MLRISSALVLFLLTIGSFQRGVLSEPSSVQQSIKLIDSLIHESGVGSVQGSSDDVQQIISAILYNRDPDFMRSLRALVFGSSQPVDNLDEVTTTQANQVVGNSKQTELEAMAVYRARALNLAPNNCIKCCPFDCAEEGKNCQDCIRFDESIFPNCQELGSMYTLTERLPAHACYEPDQQAPL